MYSILGSACTAKVPYDSASWMISECSHAVHILVYTLRKGSMSGNMSDTSGPHLDI